MPQSEEFHSIPRINGVRRVKLLKDVVGYDSNWNNPQPVKLKAGTILSTGEQESTERGDLFFTLPEPTHPGNTVALPRSVLKTRYPYDLGEYDSEYLVPVITG